MRALAIALLGLLVTSNIVYAKVDTVLSDSVSPVQVLSKEELQKTNNRTVEDILNALPTANERAFQQQDIVNLRGLGANKTLVLVDGRRTDQNTSTIPVELIDRIEVLKDSASGLYGSDAISGVVNIITNKTFELHPQELPPASSFQPIELDWLKKDISIGRLGLHQDDYGQYEYGLSTFKNNQWDWDPGWKLGETYGLSGPIVALGKTPQGPGYSIYNPSGALIGDVNKVKLQSEPEITSQYLLKAEYNQLNPTYDFNNRVFKPNEFDPYGVFVLPQRRSIGDVYRTAGMLDYSLDNFKSYDSSMESLDGGCVTPYRHELVYPRSVLKEAVVTSIVPNDPLYQKEKKKRKKLLGIIGAGGLSLGGVAVDKEGPSVYDQYYLSQIGYQPKDDPESAWNLVDADTKNITVAVIDSGLDLAHPDGPQYIWTNAKEIPDNKLDDDHNGYIDDVHGWNFIDENNDLTDLRGHGTIVAGIIAARSNNGIGIAGINPGAVILPLKVADKFGNTNSLRIFRAIKYAVAHNARIINISLGAVGISDLERLAINDARSHGVLVVVASGNDGADMEDFGPSSIGSALAVGSVNYDGSRSTVSNFGENNGLMAPGEEIYSLHSKDAPWDGPAGMKDRSYTKASGTSFSAPMVAATASLLLVKNPKLTPDDLEDIIASSAQHLTEEDWNSRTGAGFLDAAKALASIDNPSLNVKITGLRKEYDEKGKSVAAIDVFATVRGDIDYFTVELGKGKNARNFKPVVGLNAQQAHNDLVAHLTESQLRGSKQWQILIRAIDKAGNEHKAICALNLK